MEDLESLLAVRTLYVKKWKKSLLTDGFAEESALGVRRHRFKALAPAWEGRNCPWDILTASTPGNTFPRCIVPTASQSTTPQWNAQLTDCTVPQGPHRGIFRAGEVWHSLETAVEVNRVPRWILRSLWPQRLTYSWEKNVMRYLWPQVGKTFVISHSWGNMSISKRTLSKIRQCVGLGCWVIGITSSSPCSCSGYFSREHWLSLSLFDASGMNKITAQEQQWWIYPWFRGMCAPFSTSVLNLPWDACLISSSLHTSWLRWFEGFRGSLWF